MLPGLALPLGPRAVCVLNFEQPLQGPRGVHFLMSEAPRRVLGGCAFSWANYP